MQLIRPAAITFTVLSLASSGTAFANRWDVHPDGSGDAITIQAAIDLAANGDSVVLAPGTYLGTGNRDISFHGKGLTVTSSAGRDLTIIDCESAGRGFIFNSGEPYSALLEEITIKNGAAGQGGALYFSNLTHVLVRRCVVTQCVASVRGGGAYFGDMSAATIADNLITGNTAPYGGGVADDQWCFSHVQHNTIRGNTATIGGGGIYSENDTGDSFFEDNTIESNVGGGFAGAGHFFTFARNRVIDNNGGGVSVAVGGAPLESNLIARNQGIGVYLHAGSEVSNCTIVGNASHGVVVENSRPTLRRCIIAFNGRDAVVCVSQTGDKAILDCCDVHGNAGGMCVKSSTNLSTKDPLFCAMSGDSAYYLHANSPCTPAYSPCGQLIGVYGVLCDSILIPPAVPYIACPADTTVPQGPSFTLVMIGSFVIGNGGAVAAAFDYQVTSTGPAALIDGGNMLSLAGTTPLLAPGESYRPPRAWLAAPAMGSFVQQVTCRVVNIPLEIDRSCTASVAFQVPVPVAFASVSARLEGRAVHLNWVAQYDDAVAEIAVRRRVNGSEPTVIGHLSADMRDYVDAAAEPGRTNVYDLQMIQDGEVVSTSSSVQVHVPSLALALGPVSPNPFRASARVVFDVPESGTVRLDVFDVAGHRVRTLMNETLSAGTREIVWQRDGDDALRSGVYFLRLSQGKLQVTRKVTILK